LLHDLRCFKPESMPIAAISGNFLMISLYKPSNITLS
jgi:hypothetical protein